MLKDFDPIFIEKNYYVGPDQGKKKSETPSKAYSLFVKILNETKKIAISKVKHRPRPILYLSRIRRNEKDSNR